MVFSDDMSSPVDYQTRSDGNLAKIQFYLFNLFSYLYFDEPEHGDSLPLLRGRTDCIIRGQEMIIYAFLCFRVKTHPFWIFLKDGPVSLGCYACISYGHALEKHASSLH